MEKGKLGRRQARPLIEDAKYKKKVRFFKSKGGVRNNKQCN
jgi:hypothetical protein